MISTELARALRTAGLRWTPAAGDRFVLDPEQTRLVPDEDRQDVYTVSDMTIEAHEYPTGTILGFNGTTEWALDSVALHEALWLPAEGQLRELLRDGFRSLAADDDGRFTVRARLQEQDRVFTADTAAEAYGEALLALLLLAVAPPS
ncbi:pilus assembly protein CpaE [Tersicoccus phoenicis]|uniref:Pilus assembly protein CpaE n=1 Tax=Tersicoccus phoenicis TaxID=554083 RepID=A0A1R1LDB2_9MICC|nr:pilus assembly protein CpaE [Tersicoccus phoenicis]OMH25475.1 pilus assembly protein CpaE [Tersicoccus phoenicis]